jgi:hypothetical protein
MSSIHDHGLSSDQIFKLVFTGWCFAIAAVATPPVLVGAIGELFVDPHEAADVFLAILLFLLSWPFRG